MVDNMMRKPCEYCGLKIHIRGYRNHLQFKHGIIQKTAPLKVVRPIGRPRKVVAVAPPPQAMEGVVGQMKSPPIKVVASAKDIVDAAKRMFSGDPYREIAFVLMTSEPVTAANLRLAADYLNAGAAEVK